MLERILQTKRQELTEFVLPKKVDVPSFSLYDAIESRRQEPAIIAEVKKASPSKGVIKEDFDPVEIARSYEFGGATAISVLTDQTYFQGSRDYLTAIKKNVNLPVLRKDFIIEESQVEESRLIGADAILLIAAVMEPAKLKALYESAHEKGLDVLVEVHTLTELEELFYEFEPRLIGVNNRNLKTFETTLETTATIAEHIPKGSLFVSESGIRTYEDMNRVKTYGANAVLVGESLMRASTPEAGLAELMGV